MIIFLFRPPLKLVFPVGYKINRTKDNSDHFSNLTQLEPFYILLFIIILTFSTYREVIQDNSTQFFFYHNLHFFDILRVTLGRTLDPLFRRQLSQTVRPLFIFIFTIFFNFQKRGRSFGMLQYKSLCFGVSPNIHGFREENWSTLLDLYM